MKCNELKQAKRDIDLLNNRLKIASEAIEEKN